MSGCKLCLDALEDEAERRQAREYIRTLGGQVHISLLNRHMLGFHNWGAVTVQLLQEQRDQQDVVVYR